MVLLVKNAYQNKTAMARLTAETRYFYRPDNKSNI